MRSPICALIPFILALLSGCAAAPSLPSGANAYTLLAAPGIPAADRDYRIGIRDRIAITVFQEPDLSFQNVEVDTGGAVLMPLIGSVAAAGKTAFELSSDIAGRLDKGFLVDPQVSVIVISPMSQKVAVEGSVVQPGVYEMRGRTTLLEALALAKGPTRTAALGQVALFRTIDGKRMGALFNVGAIRRGEADDPEIRGSDMIVVGLSNVKAAWRDALIALPALAILRPLGD